MYVDEIVTLTALSDAGGFSAANLARASHALRKPSSGLEHAIAPRALDTIYWIRKRFDAHGSDLEVSRYKVLVRQVRNRGVRGAFSLVYQRSSNSAG